MKKIKSYYTNYFTDKREKGIYLHGSFGTGKTYIVSALLNELAKKDVKSTIVHVPELLRGLKESFSSDYRDRFWTLKTTPILLLDDFMSELDEKRRVNFLENIKGNQVIITCTDKLNLNNVENNIDTILQKENYKETAAQSL